MPINSRFKSITTSLNHNLRLATCDIERFAFARQALLHAEKALGELSALLLEKGEQSEEYRLGRDAASDLLTAAGIAFVRSCSTYSQGIALLEDLALKTNDTVLRKKIRIYANQLKKRWNDAEPGGILHAPRAARRARYSRNSDRTFGTSILIFIVIIAGTIYYFKSGFTDAPELARQEYLGAPPASHISKRTVDAPPKASAPKSNVSAPAPARAGDYCRYTDSSGVIHLVNDPARVPARYRSRMVVVASGEGSSGGNATPVRCAENRVLVPVKLRYQGREVETVLLLDTGASTTTINDAVAARLGIDTSRLQVGRSIVADGRVVRSYLFSADLVSVGQKRLSGQTISILAGSGGNGAQGLLGMNFLKEFRYHVDFNRRVIEWGS